MKIAVCSLYINEWYREIVKYGKKVVHAYCNMHDYDFIYETENTPNTVYNGDRDCPWYKIKLLLKVLEDKNSTYDYVIWNDADSLIMNNKIQLEDIIQKYFNGKDILLARDCTSILNTGTMFVKCTSNSIKILKHCWNNKEKFDRTLHEQASLSQMYTSDALNCKQYIEVLPNTLQNVFLSYWHSYYPNDCFILHITRCAHDRLGFIFTMDKFCPIKIDEESWNEYLDRKAWLLDTKTCRAEIQHYLQGGERVNPSTRYKTLYNKFHMRFGK